MKKTTLRLQTILYYNEIENLEKSLSSVAKAVEVSKQKGGPIEFIDICYGDASATPLFTEEKIAEYNKKYGEFFNLEYMFFGFNSGTSKGQNVMFESCKSEYLLAMNPDVVLCPEFFLEMIKPYETMESVGMVEARQCPLEHPKIFDPKTGEEPWGAMACVIIPSEVFKKLGGLDEKNFFLYCDDVDFSWRLRLNGYKVIYRPRAFVYHAKRIDDKGGVQPTSAELYYSAEAALLMAYKYSDDARLKRFLQLFEKGSEQQRKAAAEFYRRKENGLLTERLDKDHRIASFTEWGYSENRY